MAIEEKKVVGEIVKKAASSPQEASMENKPNSRSEKDEDDFVQVDHTYLKRFDADDFDRPVLGNFFTACIFVAILCFIWLIVGVDGIADALVPYWAAIAKYVQALFS